MKILCGNCGATIQKEGDDAHTANLVSHGICKTCGPIIDRELETSAALPARLPVSKSRALTGRSWPCWLIIAAFCMVWWVGAVSLIQWLWRVLKGTL